MITTQRYVSRLSLRTKEMITSVMIGLTHEIAKFLFIDFIHSCLHYKRNPSSIFYDYPESPRNQIITVLLEIFCIAVVTVVDGDATMSQCQVSHVVGMHSPWLTNKTFILSYRLLRCIVRCRCFFFRPHYLAIVYQSFALS